MQTGAKTFADIFPYPICNLCAVILLYFAIYQRLIKFMTSTSLSAEHNKKIASSLLERGFFIVFCNAPPQAGRDVQRSEATAQIPESEG